jgi:uncharacterized protein (TIGR02271 family)
MGELNRVVFRGEGGLTAWVDPALPLIETMERPHTYVYLEDGQQVPVEISRLRRDSDGGYSLTTTVEQVLEAETPVVRNPLDEVVTETVAVAAPASERVKVTKTVEEQKHVISEPMLHEQVSVERVPIGQYVEDVPVAREENGVMIFPVVEEVLVVEKRYLLKEEVRVTKTREVRPDDRVFTTLTERASVEPTDEPLSEGITMRPFTPGSAVVGPSSSATGQTTVVETTVQPT